MRYVMACPHVRMVIDTFHVMCNGWSDAQNVVGQCVVSTKEKKGSMCHMRRVLHDGAFGRYV